MLRPLATLGLCALLSLPPAPAAGEEMPAIEKLRYNEDYSALRNQPCPRTWPDCWKFIPLDNASNNYLSLGGEIRQRYEYTENPLFGEDPQDKRGVWLQRYGVHGDLHLGEHLRFFGQLTSALEAGRNGGPSPVDENKLEIQNGFIDLSGKLTGATDLTLRAGRQEIVLGSGRLVDVREGPNVRRTFDGGRGFIELANWQLDLLAARPRLERSGVFDDKTNNKLGLWGIYSTAGEGLLPQGRLDLYYLGYQNKEALFTQGAGDERRHSIGGRAWGIRDNWSWNWEALYQFGRFADGDIRAWTLATETSHRWPLICWQPEFRLSINIASGDDNPNDMDLGTFNPLFPRGNYFSEAAVLGPRNFYNFHPLLILNPSQKLSFTADVNFFWRLKTEDSVYSPSGQIIRRPNGSKERFVGSTLSLTADYAVSDRLSFVAIHTHFVPGSFINETGPSKDIYFTELTLQYRF